MPSRISLKLAGVFALLVIIAALLSVRIDMLNESAKFFRWVKAEEAEHKLPVIVARNQDTPEERLYSEYLQAGKKLADQLRLGDFDSLSDRAKWSLVKHREMQTLVSDFSGLLRNRQITSIATGEISYADPGVGAHLGQLILGLRNVAADLLWLKVDEYWHQGLLNRMVPLMRTVVKLDPHFIEAYSIGAWHLAYNVTVTLKTDQERQDYIMRGVHFMDEGIRNNPWTYRLYFEQGFTLYQEKLNDYPNAIKYLEESVQKPDHKLWVERCLYIAYERNKQYDDAIRGWKMYIEEHPEDRPIYERFVRKNEVLKSASSADYETLRKTWLEFADQFPIDADVARINLLLAEANQFEQDGKYLDAYYIWYHDWRDLPFTVDEVREKLAELRKKIPGDLPEYIEFYPPS